MTYLLNLLFPWLLKYVPFKEIGWHELGEVFYRFQIFKSNWFNIYLHRLDAPNWHPECHDHPWHFWTIILSNGYYEYDGKKFVFRALGSILFRHAKFKHSVITKGVSWSLIITSSKVRNWEFINCKG